VTVGSVHERAFAVWFKDMRLWSVGSFHQMRWHWPAEYIKPLSSALTRKQIEVNRREHSFDSLSLVTLHFDGSMEKRNLHGKSNFKGGLRFAEAGDVIYSKIDVRNGAIGVVPPEMPRVAVSTEYPVYDVNPSKALPEYVQLVFRTSYFRRAINSMISGASGRKRVQPEQIEALDAPLPPLPVQRVIVERWQQAQQQIAAAGQRSERFKADIDARFLKDLGLKPPVVTLAPKALAVWWEDLFQWSGRATIRHIQVKDLQHGKYPLVAGRDCLREVRHGCGHPPSPKPTGLDILKISAATRGEFCPSERKSFWDKPRYREEFDLRKGDVLMCRTNGTLAYVGMSALIEEDQANLIFPDKLIRVRVQDNIEPAYLWRVLQLPPLRAQIEAAARTAVGNYAIGTPDIWNLQIPLPPLPVQRVIMERITAARAAIAREQENVARLASEAESEVEAMILGTRPVPATGD
jgi:type I restriction enzyme, S subunit